MALLLDGTDDQIDHGASPGVSGQALITWMAWVMPTNALVDGDGFFLEQTDANNYFNFRVSGTSGAVAFGNNTAGSSRTGTSTTGLIAVNTWVHLAAIYDGTQGTNNDRFQVAVDGSRRALTYAGAGSFPATWPAFTGNFLIGRSSAAGTFFEGHIAHVKMFQAALTDAQIFAQMNAYRPLTGSCTLHSPYDDGTSAKDYSGSGNHGTVTGTTQSQGPPVSYGGIG